MIHRYKFAFIRVVLNRMKLIAIQNKNKYYCPICKTHIKSFKGIDDAYLSLLQQNHFEHSIFQFETLNVFQYSCPQCGSSDRNRLYALYFQKIFQNNAKSEKISFLDIAPDRNLQKMLRRTPGIIYRSADKYMKGVDDNIDITNLSIYNDNLYDYILCSHILEHVESDIRAIHELYRVLKPGGKAIIMAPILLTINKDIEGGAAESEEYKWEHFGQNDHVRLYSKIGFLSKIRSAGFSVVELGIEFFGQSTFDESGISPGSILYVASK